MKVRLTQNVVMQVGAVRMRAGEVVEVAPMVGRYLVCMGQAEAVLDVDLSILEQQVETAMMRAGEERTPPPAPPHFQKRKMERGEEKEWDR